MRCRFQLMFLLVAARALAQPFSPNDVAFSAAIRARSGSVFNPNTVSNCQFFLSYLDAPRPAKPAYWISHTNNIYFTNQGVGAFPSNTASGMYFDGSSGNFFRSPVLQWSNRLDSVWIYCQPTNVSDSWGNIIATDNSAGTGVYTRGGAPNTLTYITGTLGAITSNVWYSLCFVPTNLPPSSTQPFQNAYTNSIWNGSCAMVDQSTPAQKLWGIGQDADADQTMKGFIKFIAIYTNYTLSPVDVSNLTYYGQNN